MSIIYQIKGFNEICPSKKDNEMVNHRKMKGVNSESAVLVSAQSVQVSLHHFCINAS